MKQVLAAAVSIVVGFGTFGGMLWLSIFATDYEESVTNQLARLAIHLILWSLEAVVFALVVYIIHLVYKQYTDTDVTAAELRKQKKFHNPEFE